MSEFILASELRQEYTASQPAIKVITNNVPRPLLAGYELPLKTVQEEFAYTLDDDGSQRFIRYKGWWYDTQDTVRITVGVMGRAGWDMYVGKDHPFAKWDAVISDSFFSGVLFRFVETDDGDSVVCGRYYS